MRAQVTQEEAIKVYLRCLEEEEQKPDTRGARGRCRNARRRAIDRLQEELKYKSHHGARQVVVRWEKTNGKGSLTGFNDFGLELDDDFKADISRQKYNVSMACHALRKFAFQCGKDGLLNGQDKINLDALEDSLMDQYPRSLCAFCKGCLDECDGCHGKGWVSHVGNLDSRLLDEENLYVVFEGRVRLLEEVVDAD